MALVLGSAMASSEVLAEDYVNLTGSFRMNYTVQDWNDAQKNRGGDFGFNQINLGVEAKHKEVRISSSYRWYDNGNPSMKNCGINPYCAPTAPLNINRANCNPMRKETSKGKQAKKSPSGDRWGKENKGRKTLKQPLNRPTKGHCPTVSVLASKGLNRYKGKTQNKHD